MTPFITKSLALMVTSLLLGACPITTFIDSNSSHTAKYTLRQIIDGDLCASACWQYLEPGTSTLQEVDEMLDADGISPYVVRRMEDNSPITYEWQYIGPKMPNSALEQMRTGVVVFSETGIVIRVVMLTVDVCLTTLINEYGLPSEITRDNLGDIQLLYAQHGLIFTPNNSRVSIIARVTAEEFTDENNTSLPIGQLSTMLDFNCIDAFSS